jgi:hypothetical protein
VGADVAGKKRPSFPPAKGVSLSGDIEIVREPTPDELWDQLRELMQAQLLHPLPREVFFRQRRLIEWQITHPTPYQVDWLRWSAVLLALNRGTKWDDVFDIVSTMLKGTPAEAGPEATFKSYKKIQKQLPPDDRRRPRTGGQDH